MIAPNNTAWSPFPPSKLYFFMGGTSMATPLTAGAVAVVRQYLRTKAGISTPSAALMKACLIAGAQRIEGGTAKVFDSDQGFGRVSLDAVLAPAKPASAQFFDVKPGLSTGAVKTIAIKVRSKKAPLRVVLVYSDYPGRSLVNNLNLIVKSPSGTTYAGNGAPDAVNNVEAVRVTSPAAGAWTLQVVGSSVPQGPQAYALVVIGDLG
jgi:hypothetical protein